MSRFLVIHRVEDYAKWKPIFDEDSGPRQAAGGQGGTVFRDSNDPNNIVILWEWESAQKAHEFAEAPRLREVMARAGVQGMPTIIFLDDVEKVKV